MKRELLTVVALILAVTSGAEKPLEFSIIKDLDNGKILDSKHWCKVTINNICSQNSDAEVYVKVLMPLGTLNNSNISVYFANEAKNILQVNLSRDIVHGILYATPYLVERDMGTQSKSSKFETTVQNELSGKFPRSWLPENCNKVSASVETSEWIHNYYGIKNRKVSIPDLQVVEEYKTYSCTESV